MKTLFYLVLALGILAASTYLQHDSVYSDDLSSRSISGSEDDEIFAELKTLADETHKEEVKRKAVAQKRKPVKKKKIVNVYPEDNYGDEVSIEDSFKKEQEIKERKWRAQQMALEKKRQARLQILREERQSQVELQRQKQEETRIKNILAHHEKKKKTLPPGDSAKAKAEFVPDYESDYKSEKTEIETTSATTSDYSFTDSLFVPYEGDEPRSVVSFEYWGRGLNYSVNFDYLITPMIAAGAGFTQHNVSAEDRFEDFKIEIMTFPIYGNLYYSFRDPRHKVFGSAGATIVNMQTDLDYEDEYLVEYYLQDEFPIDLQIGETGTYTFPTIGVGYEFRSNTYIVGRIAAYGLYSTGAMEEKFHSWGGISVGIGF